MPRRRCRTRPADHDTLSVHSPDDALMLARVVVDRVGACLAAVCLDDWGALVDVLAVDAPPDALEQFALDVLELAAPIGMGALVLLTLRGLGTIEVAEADIERWRRLRARYDEAGVELLDWFVVTGAWARSMAETAGSDPRW